MSEEANTAGQMNATKAYEPHRPCSGGLIGHDGALPVLLQTRPGHAPMIGNHGGGDHGKPRPRRSSIMVATEESINLPACNAQRQTAALARSMQCENPSKSGPATVRSSLDTRSTRSSYMKSAPGIQPTHQSLLKAFETSQASPKGNADSSHLNTVRFQAHATRRSWASIVPNDDYPTAEEPPTMLGGWAVFKRLLWDVLHLQRSPDRRIRRAWDVLQLANITINITVVPFCVSFLHPLDSRQAPATPGVPPWKRMTLVMDILYLLDMAMQTRLSFVDESGSEVASRSQITRRYARSWLGVDLLTVVPDLVLFTGLQAQTQTYRRKHLIAGLHYLSQLRLLRLLRKNSAVAMIEPHLGRAATSILAVLALALLLLHTMACLFHWVAAVQLPRGGVAAAAPEEFWLGSLTWLESAGMADASALTRYRLSMYWICAAITTTGYGDIRPGTYHELGFSMFAMLIAISVFSYFMTTVSAAAKLVDAQGLRLAKMQEDAEQFVRANRLPPALRARITAYYAFAAEHGVGDHDARLVGGLSLQLQQDVLLSMHYRLLRAMPFFAAQPTAFMLRIVQALGIVVVPPGEFVVMQGVVSPSMFFVSCGTFSRVVSDDAAAFREEVVRCRVRRLDLRTPRLQSRSGSWLPGARILSSRITSQESCADAQETGVLSMVDYALYSKQGTYTVGDHFGEESCILDSPSDETVVADTFCKCVQLYGPDLAEVMDSFQEQVRGDQGGMHVISAGPHHNLPAVQEQVAPGLGNGTRMLQLQEHWSL